jgi:hypothetical protein
MNPIKSAIIGQQLLREQCLIYDEGDERGAFSGVWEVLNTSHEGGYVTKAANYIEMYAKSGDVAPISKQTVITTPKSFDLTPFKTLNIEVDFLTNIQISWAFSIGVVANKTQIHATWGYNINFSGTSVHENPVGSGTTARKTLTYNCSSLTYKRFVRVICWANNGLPSYTIRARVHKIYLTI